MKYKVVIYNKDGITVDSFEFEKLNRALEFINGLILEKLEDSNIAEMEFDFIEL
jgi:hypothetical protein